MLRRLLFVMGLSVFSLSSQAEIAGEMQGPVKAVSVSPTAMYGYSSFYIYFKTLDYSSVDCGTYVRVRSDAPGLDADSYQQIFSLAVSAQMSGKSLALSMSGSNCTWTNGAFMIDTPTPATP